jgi:hypothetical protein
MTVGAIGLDERGVVASARRTIFRFSSEIRAHSRDSRVILCIITSKLRQRDAYYF